jgi:hypothetical protein
VAVAVAGAVIAAGTAFVTGTGMEPELVSGYPDGTESVSLEMQIYRRIVVGPVRAWGDLLGGIRRLRKIGSSFGTPLGAADRILLECRLEVGKLA